MNQIVQQKYIDFTLILPEEPANGIATPIQNIKMGKTRSTHPIPETVKSRLCEGGGF